LNAVKSEKNSAEIFEESRELPALKKNKRGLINVSRAARDNETTMTTIVPSLPNLPDETQIIASFLLKYVERCILDANCLKAYEFDEVYGEPFLIEHEQSREFKKNLTCFLRAHLIDSPVTPEERIQKGIDGYNVPETIVARSSRSHLDEAGSNGSVSTIPSYPGTVGQTSELVDVRFQPSDTNYPMHPKNPDDDGIESLSSEPSKKRSRSESCVKPEREDLVDSVSQEFSKPGMRKTMSTIEAFSMRIQDIRKACETLESLESSNENTEALFMSVWRHSAIGGAGALRGTNVHQLERHIILALNMVVFAHTVREKQRYKPFLLYYRFAVDISDVHRIGDLIRRKVKCFIAVFVITSIAKLKVMSLLSR